MMTSAELAARRAHDYVRDRGWRHEPLSWEEVAALLDWVEGRAGEMCTCGCTGECAS